MATFTARVDLPVCAHTVRDARVFALAVADAWHSPVRREDLALLVDDLTDAVVARARGEHSLSLELTGTDQRLRVGLADGSAVRPVTSRLLHGRVGDDLGRVAAVMALAHRWGYDDHQGGQRLWFELDAPEEPLVGDGLDLDVEIEIERRRRAGDLWL